MTTINFSVSNILKDAFQVFRADWKKHLLVAFAVVLIDIIFREILQLILGTSDIAYVNTLIFVISSVYSSFLYLFLTAYALVHARGTQMSISEILKFIFNFRMFINYYIVGILTFVLAFLGFLLLIIPGVVISLGVMFAGFLVVDKNVNAIESIKTSWSITKGYKWQLFLLLLALILIATILAMTVILFPIALLYTIFALAVAYDYLSSKNDSADEDQEDEDDEEDDNNEQNLDEDDKKSADDGDKEDSKGYENKDAGQSNAGQGHTQNESDSGTSSDSSE